MKYRKKPVVIEAELYKPGLEDGTETWCDWYDSAVNGTSTCEYCVCRKECNAVELHQRPYIDTLEGKHFISEGDYIITGVKGERYPCKPDIFMMTYEPVKGDGED